MNVKNLFRRENNANNEEDHGRICLHRIQHLPLFSLSGSSPGNVRWCPRLALGTLFKSTSNPQSVALFFRCGWAPLFCPAAIPSAHGPVVVHLMTWEDCQYVLHLPPKGASGVIGRVGTLCHSQGALFSFQGRWWECFSIPSPFTLVCPRFFPIMYGFWWISCPFPVRGQSV